MGEILVMAGFGLLVLGGLWFWFNVFSNSVLWGVACVITGIAMLPCLVLYWQDTKRPFFCMLGGAALGWIGARMAPEAALLQRLLG